jgi:hypothetical protein
MNETPRPLAMRERMCANRWRACGAQRLSVELEELWCFVHTKEKRLHEDDPAE